MLVYSIHVGTNASLEIVNKIKERAVEVGSQAKMLQRVFDTSREVMSLVESGILDEKQVTILETKFLKNLTESEIRRVGWVPEWLFSTVWDLSGLGYGRSRFLGRLHVELTPAANVMYAMIGEDTRQIKLMSREQNEKFVIVIIIFQTGGGTGSSLWQYALRMVRTHFDNEELNYMVLGIAILPTGVKYDAVNAANSVACLNELAFFHSRREEHVENEILGQGELILPFTKGFDLILLCDYVKIPGDPNNPLKKYDKLADYIARFIVSSCYIPGTPGSEARGSESDLNNLIGRIIDHSNRSGLKLTFGTFGVSWFEFPEVNFSRWCRLTDEEKNVRRRLEPTLNVGVVEEELAGLMATPLEELDSGMVESYLNTLRQKTGDVLQPQLLFLERIIETFQRGITEKNEKLVGLRKEMDNLEKSIKEAKSMVQQLRRVFPIKFALAGWVSSAVMIASSKLLTAIGPPLFNIGVLTGVSTTIIALVIWLTDWIRKRQERRLRRQIEEDTDELAILGTTRKSEETSLNRLVVTQTELKKLEGELLTKREELKTKLAKMNGEIKMLEKELLTFQHPSMYAFRNLEQLQSAKNAVYDAINQRLNRDKLSLNLIRDLEGFNNYLDLLKDASRNDLLLNVRRSDFHEDPRKARFPVLWTIQLSHAKNFDEGTINMLTTSGAIGEISGELGLQPKFQKITDAMDASFYFIRIVAGIPIFKVRDIQELLPIYNEWEYNRTTAALYCYPEAKESLKLDTAFIGTSEAKRQRGNEG